MAPLSDLQEAAPLTVLQEAAPLAVLQEAAPLTVLQEAAPLTVLQEIAPSILLCLHHTLCHQQREPSIISDLVTPPLQWFSSHPLSFEVLLFIISSLSVECTSTLPFSTFTNSYQPFPVPVDKVCRGQAFIGSRDGHVMNTIKILCKHDIQAETL